MTEHFYIYIFENGKYLYERTCGTKKGTEIRVAELKEQGRNAIYSTTVIEGAFY